MPNTPALNFSDHEIDVLMATLARHFNIDLADIDADPKPPAEAPPKVEHAAT